MNLLSARTTTSLPSLFATLRETDDDDTLVLRSERRQGGRIPCSLYARCHEVRLLPRPARAARVRDVSADGIGLLVSRPFTPGLVLGIELQTATGQIEARIRARVEHATWLPDDGCWLVGCAAAG
jgi:hypothetical protein